MTLLQNTVVKTILYTLLVSTLPFWMNCSKMAAIKNDTIVPFPTIKNSIIPLSIRNYWNFSHTSYDSVGKKLTSQESLFLQIGKSYGLLPDLSLVEITKMNDQVKYTEYVFEFEWEKLNEGWLITFKDQKIDTPGIYIRGIYSGQNKTLFPQCKLWLAFPVKNTLQWKFLDPNAVDTVPSIWQVLDTGAIFSIPQSSDASKPLMNQVQCYLYKVTKANSIEYFYFRRSLGPVGFLSYTNNKLQRSFILSSYFCN